MRLGQACGKGEGGGGERGRDHGPLTHLRLQARELDIAGHGDFGLAATTLTAAAATGSRDRHQRANARGCRAGRRMWP